MRSRAVEFVSEHGREDDRAGTTWADFNAAFGLMDVAIYHSGDFGLNLHDRTGRYFDGYWPHVGFFANGTAVECTTYS